LLRDVKGRKVRWAGHVTDRERSELHTGFW